MMQDTLETKIQVQETAELERRELHHRISNSLQIVSAFLRLKRNKIDPETAVDILDRAADRVDAIGHFHRYIAEKDDAGSVSFTDMAGQLMTDICKSVGLDCHIEGEEIVLSTDKALSLVIIINELAINAHKHGYGNRDGGEFNVHCQRLDDEIVLTISDAGKGLPAGFDLSEPQGLGFEVITSTVERMGGWLECKNREEGAAFRIGVPVD